MSYCPPWIGLNRAAILSKDSQPLSRMRQGAIPSISSRLRKTRLYKQYEERQIAKSNFRAIMEWESRGRPVPPPHALKQQVVLQFKKQTGLETLIESGTYLGQMVEGMASHFSRIYSIELSASFHQRALAKFADKKHIVLLNGDSARILPALLSQMNQPCLFWLDGHFSEGLTAKGELNTPIVRELECILAHPVMGHVILVDDARCFNGRDDYPTIDQVQSLLKSADEGWCLEVDSDIIRIQQTGLHAQAYL